MTDTTATTAPAAADAADESADGIVSVEGNNAYSEQTIAFWNFITEMIAADVTAFSDKDSDNVISARRMFGTLDKDEKRHARIFVRDEINTLLASQSEVSARIATDPTAATEIVAIAQRSAAFAAVKDNCLKALSAPTNSQRKTADPIEAALAIVAPVALAYSVAMSAVPAGIDADEFTARVTALLTADESTAATDYRAWIENGMATDEPNVSNLAKRAARISLGRSPSGQGRKPDTAKVAKVAADENGSDENGSPDTDTADNE